MHSHMWIDYESNVTSVHSQELNLVSTCLNFSLIIINNTYKLTNNNNIKIKLLKLGKLKFTK